MTTALGPTLVFSLLVVFLDTGVRASDERERPLTGIAREFPALVEVDLGEVPADEVTQRWVEIANETGEPFVTAKTETDCGCALGFVEGKETPAGGTVRVYVKVQPSKPGDFRRTISIVGNDNSNRKILLAVSARAKPRFIASRGSLRFSPRVPKPIDLSLSCDFGTKFDDSAIVLSPDTFFDVEVVRKDSERIDLQLTLKEERSNDISRWMLTAPSYERIQFGVEGGKKAAVEIPVLWEKQPQVQPSTFRMSSANKTKFFLIGDFGLELEDLKDSDIVALVGGLELSVDAEWRNERVCVCSVQFPTLVIENEKIETGYIRVLTKGSDVLLEQQIRLMR